MKFVVTENGHSTWRFTCRLLGTLLTLTMVLMAITACSTDTSAPPIKVENTPAPSKTQTPTTQPSETDNVVSISQVIETYKKAPTLVDLQPYLATIDGSYQKLTMAYKLTSPLSDVPKILSDAGYAPITDSTIINKIFGKTENDVYGRASDNTLIAWSVEHGIDEDLTVVYAHSSDGNLPDLKKEPVVKYVFDPSLINKVTDLYKDVPDFSASIGTQPKKIDITALEDVLMYKYYVNIDSRDAHIKTLQTTLESAGFTPTGESNAYKKGSLFASYDYGDPVNGVSEVSVTLKKSPDKG
ncbi:hypothetical protein E0485_00070 [Paenibacillus albiflavus]|uniref:Uncharacterized protein n=1 Tax=Paenibacillus albiflavus TaxID=2545760 RepID=A0A4R4EMF4_9BACL|nr:hypothetical protein [Paenibacillus albiflavus]TCZ80733.1 hypothetical protein E0485_00070 [Paenibacillus albiflavus]